MSVSSMCGVCSGKISAGQPRASQSLSCGHKFHQACFKQYDKGCSICSSSLGKREVKIAGRSNAVPVARKALNQEPGSSTQGSSGAQFTKDEISKYAPLYFKFYEGLITKSELLKIVGAKRERFSEFQKAINAQVFGSPQKNGLPPKFSDREVKIFIPMFVQIIKKEKTMNDFVKEIGNDTQQGKAVLVRFQTFSRECKEMMQAPKAELSHAAFSKEEIGTFSSIYYELYKGAFNMVDVLVLLEEKTKRFNEFKLAMNAQTYESDSKNGLPPKFSEEELKVFKVMWKQLISREKTMHDFAEEIGRDALQDRMKLQRFKIFAIDCNNCLSKESKAKIERMEKEEAEKQMTNQLIEDTTPSLARKLDTLTINGKKVFAGLSEEKKREFAKQYLENEAALMKKQRDLEKELAELEGL